MSLIKCPKCGTELSDNVNTCPTCGCQITDAKETQNLYELARCARKKSNFSDAQKYYEQIALVLPLDWEADFYAKYCAWISCKNEEIPTVVNQAQSTLTSILSSIEKNVSDESKRIEAINSIATDLATLLTTLNTTAITNKNTLSFNCLNVGISCYNILYNFGDYIYKNYGGICKDSLLLCWTTGVKIEYDVVSGYIVASVERKKHREHIESYAEKIRIYDSSYKAPKVFIRTESKGCYVATCVYGSYDCPQVWALRRFRDDTLGSTWYGRAFIRTYYAISPTLVKWFGETKWFKKMWKGTLDRMVNKLESKGVENTPYQDKEW